MTQLPKYINEFLKKFDDEILQTCACLYIFSIPFQVNIIGTSHTASYFLAIVLTLTFAANCSLKPKKDLFTFWPLLILAAIFFIDVEINKSALFDSQRLHIKSFLHVIILSILITIIRYGKVNLITVFGVSYILGQLITCLIFISKPPLEYFDYYFQITSNGYLEIVIDNSFSVFGRAPNDVAYGFLCTIGLSIYLLAHNLNKNRPLRCCLLFFVVILMSYGITYTANRGSVLGVFVLFIILSIYFYLKNIHIKSMLLIFLASLIVISGAGIYNNKELHFARSENTTLRGKLTDIGSNNSFHGIEQIDYKDNDFKIIDDQIDISKKVLQKNYDYRKESHKIQKLLRLKSETLESAKDPIATQESVRELLKNKEFSRELLKTVNFRELLEQQEKSLKHLNNLQYLSTYGFRESYCSNRALNIISTRISSSYPLQKNIPCREIVDPKKIHMADLHDKGIKFLKKFISLKIVEVDGKYRYLKNDGTHFSTYSANDSVLSLGGRMSSWMLAYDLLEENIFFGIGNDNFERISHFLKIGSVHPHNLFIHVYILSGIIGLFILLAPFILPLLKLKKYGVWSLNSNIMYVILCFGPIVGLAAMSLNVYTLKDWWLFLALIIGLWIKNADKTEKFLIN